MTQQSILHVVVNWKVFAINVPNVSMTISLMLIVMYIGAIVNLLILPPVKNMK